MIFANGRCGFGGYGFTSRNKCDSEIKCESKI